MNFRTRKNIALWILLMFFSKMAFAIYQPVPSQNTQTIFPQVKTHHHHEQASSIDSQHEERSANCELNCDCCTVHCNTPALPTTVFLNSECRHQVPHSLAIAQQQVKVTASLFRPPIPA
ncbi:hypothetical protein [Zhongshania aliphaticivorans]|uniref:hypothetical protein n=1 Tax=Zhongshania aliphaticivorans TaxID=1470434 RepID=UPI001330AA39|nr:hypothetical protein [Zhongshania aliphaticivorans]